MNNAINSAKRPDDVEPVVSIPGLSAPNDAGGTSACCHVKEGELRFLCPISGNGEFLLYPCVAVDGTESVVLLMLLGFGTVEPVYAFAFLRTFIDILHGYFGTLSVETLKDNFDIVYQVHTSPALVCM